MGQGKKSVGVILSGAGHLDGSEIQEAVLILLAIDQLDAEARVFAPDTKLAEVDHLQSKSTGSERNVLVEAARIARGKVTDLAKVKGTDVDAWVMPGGYGAAKNLSDFAQRGSNATVHKEVARVLREALAAQIPIGAACIAPVVLAAATKTAGTRLRLTIGNDPDTAKAIQTLGAVHVECRVDDVVIDAERRVVSTPAYQYDSNIASVNAGIVKMVKQVLEWVSAA
jgi:enhancing lycopene biosynthesis protein 2